MRLNFKVINGETLFIDVPETTTFGSLKNTFSEHFKIPEKRVVFIYSGQKISEDSTFSDLAIDNPTTIHVVFKRLTVIEMKRMFCKETGVPVANQYFMNNNTRLHDDDIVSDIENFSEMTVTMGERPFNPKIEFYEKKYKSFKTYVAELEEKLEAYKKQLVQEEKVPIIENTSEQMSVEDLQVVLGQYQEEIIQLNKKVKQYEEKETEDLREMVAKEKQTQSYTQGGTAHPVSRDDYKEQSPVTVYGTSTSPDTVDYATEGTTFENEEEYLGQVPMATSVQWHPDTPKEIVKKSLQQQMTEPAIELYDEHMTNFSRLSDLYSANGGSSI